MLDWLGYIAENIVHYLQMAFNLFVMALDSISLLAGNLHTGPMFLTPIMLCVFSAAVIMWVVNLF